MFSPIDGRGNLFGQVEALLTGIMDPIRAAGGVFEGFDPVTGDAIDKGYSVDSSGVNNGSTSLASGIVNCGKAAKTRSFNCRNVS